jgi:hypothetical protein
MTKQGNKRTKQNKMMRVRRGPINPDPGLIHYLGPISPTNHDTSTVTLYDNQSVDMDGAGNLALFINNNPSSARNWSEYSTSWLEYRVLAIKVSYFPKVNTPLVGVILGFDGYHSVVHSTTVASPASLAQASSTGLSRGWNAFQRVVRTWRMETPAEAGFVLTSTPATTSQAFMFYAVAGGAAIHYGNIDIQYLVQFKTHAL